MFNLFYRKYGRLTERLCGLFSFRARLEPFAPVGDTLAECVKMALSDDQKG